MGVIYNRQLVFLWVHIVLFFLQICSFTDIMKQTTYWISQQQQNKHKFVPSFNVTFRYIDDVLSQLGDYVDRIYTIELEI